MKILENIPNYAVKEPNFEALRLALNYLGENYSEAYFHGISGTAFRIGGICPCAPTCTMAMSLTELIKLLGYDYEECSYDDNDKEKSLSILIEKVKNSIDIGIPVLVWNAFSMCEWDIVTGYDENEKIFFGRCSYGSGSQNEYTKNSWDNSLNEAGLVGITAIIIKNKIRNFDKENSEINALKEAFRHAYDDENYDKINGNDWVFLQGWHAYHRWANDFEKPDKKRELGDAYCIDIYSDCHALAGSFIREILSEYPKISDELIKAAEMFDREKYYLQQLVPLLSWNSPEIDIQRNKTASDLLRKASIAYEMAFGILRIKLKKFK